jgi:hypothetical protein
VSLGGGRRRLFRALVRQPALSDETPEYADCCELQKGMIAMADDLLVAMIIAGFGLSGAYFRAVFVSWRRNQAAERKRELSLRELHAHRLGRDKNEVPESSTVEIEKRVDRVRKAQP